MTTTITEPREELRFAVVLNGGVSLAVWIGGVTLEIDRMTRREGPYAALLDLVHSHARADVITGTSAGGINGAALALAQINHAADLSALRSLWASEGKMEALLRTPFQGAPSSLLKGDEYFLPTLQRAMRALAADYEPVAAEQRPVHLGITTTLLTGGRITTSDALGQTIPQSLHAGVLTFRHPEPGTASGDDHDDFSPEAIEETTRRLALAARSSAGFPIAFEPSYLPLRPRRPSGPGDRGRPDLIDHANWGDRGSDLDQSRYAVDGGVLSNTPTIAALDAIDAMPSTRAVRRVMLLVFPHAPEDVAAPAADPTRQPTVTETVGGVVAAMRGEAGRTHVEQVARHNRRAAERRGGRADVLTSLHQQSRRTGTTLPDLLDDMTESLYEHYRDLRIRRSARDFADRAPVIDGWSYERVLRAVEIAQDELRASRVRMPYVPDSFTPVSSFSRARWEWGITTAEHLVEDVLDLLRRLTLARPSTDMSASLQEARQAAFEARSKLLDARRRFNDIWCAPPFATIPRSSEFWKVWLDMYGRAFSGGARVQDPDLLPLSEDEAVRAPMVEALASLPDQDLGRAVSTQLPPLLRAVARLRPLVEGAADAARHGQALSASDLQDAPVLDAWVDLLRGVSAEVDASIDRLTTRLIQLDVVTTCLSNAPDRGSDQIVELVQISLQTESPFATYSTTAADKLGGNRLGRFAGFLKESWRVNDWTWGRLDAAAMLCRVALEPRRVRRWAQVVAPSPRDPSSLTSDEAREGAESSAREFVDQLVRRLFPGERPGDGFDPLVDAAIDELATYVFSASVPADLPPTLRHTADLFAWAIQADIAADELPALRVAIGSDQGEGAARGSAGTRFVAEHEQLLDGLRDLPAHPRTRIPSPDSQVTHDLDADGGRRRSLGIAALRAFDRAGVGREPLDQEASGDLLIRTGATTAAVAVTMLDSPHLGVPAARPLTRTVRGLALVPYWLARGLTSGSQIAQSLALVVLAIGAATLGVSLLASSTPRWVALLGISAVLFSVGYAALRTGSLLHGLVLVSPVVPLLAYALAERADGSAEADATNASPLLLVVLALIAGAVLLGSIPGLLVSPFRAAGDHPGRAAAAAVVVLTVAALVVTEWWFAWSGQTTKSVGTWVGDHADLDWRNDAGPSGGGVAALAIAAVVVLALFAVLAHRRTAQLRTWYVDAGTDGTGPRGWRTARVVHPSGVAAGWAWVYAVLSVVIAVLTALVTSSAFDDEQQVSSVEIACWATVATAVALAVGLLAAVPLLPAGAKRGFERQLTSIASGGAFTVPDSEAGARASLVRRLVTRGTTYCYLVEPDAGGADLQLTDAGKDLAARLRVSANPPAATAAIGRGA